MFSGFENGLFKPLVAILLVLGLATNSLTVISSLPFFGHIAGLTIVSKWCLGTSSLNETNDTLRFFLTSLEHLICGAMYLRSSFDSKWPMICDGSVAGSNGVT